MSKYVIMMVGKTHSGKTTFGYNLEKAIKNSVVLQTDPISLFIQENFSVDIDPDFEYNGEFKNPALKFKLFSSIFDHILELKKYTLILSNSNMHQKARTEMISKIRNHGYRVIGIFMNYPEEFLLNRIKKSNRDAKYLNLSNSFQEVLLRQRNLFIEPRKEEFDVLFEINSENQIHEIQDKITEPVLEKLS